MPNDLLLMIAISVEATLMLCILADYITAALLQENFIKFTIRGLLFWCGFVSGWVCIRFYFTAHAAWQLAFGG